MNTQRTLISILTLVQAPMWACSGPADQPQNGGGNGTAEVRIPETTKTLTGTDLSALESVSDDLSSLVFSGETETLSGLATGDVLACGVHGSMLPYGLLRRITSIDRGGGTVTLNTRQAALTEAIERGSLNQTVTLSPDQIVTRVSRLHNGRGLRYGMQEDGQGFVFALNDYELYDADGNPATRSDRVWVDGNFSFLPTLSFEIDIDGFELQTLTFSIGSEQQASIRVTAGREATFDESEVLAEIELTPITFSIGPVPVVLVPRIQFRVGVDGTVTADLTAGVQADASVQVGFGYQNGSFGPTSEFDSHAEFDAPNFREGASGVARVWAGPRAELAAYGIAGVFGELRGFVRGEVDSAANPWWQLSAGVEALAGVFIEVFDLTIADYQTDPLSESIELADAGGPAPSEQAEVITWARSFSGGDRDNIENPLAVIATADGGSLVAGGTNSFTSSPSDAWLIKLDRLGQVSWQRAFEDHNVAIGVVPHPEGGYLVLTGVVGTGADNARLFRVDANGDPLWARRYEADQPLGGYGLVTRGNDFVIGGVYGSGTAADFWLAAVDGDGQVQWSTAIGGDAGEQVDGLVANDDGTVVAVGPTHSFGVSFNGHWVVKFSADGTPLWQRSFDGSGNEWAHDVVADAGGNYKVLGRTGSDALVTYLNGAGQLLSATVFDAGSPFEEAFAALGTPDGGLLVAGNTGLGGDADLWLLRLTPQLEVLWTTSYGGAGRDEAGGTIQYGATSRPLAMTEDQGFLVLANSTSFGESFSDAWVQKVSGTGTITYDDGSSAVRTSLAGGFQSYGITDEPTTAVARDVALTVTEIDAEVYTPDAVVTTQATP